MEESLETLGIDHFFSDPDESPYDEINWEKRSVSINDENGEVIFSNDNVEVPDFWSQLATKVVASKYFYQEPGNEETSVKDLVHRVARTISDWGVRDGYLTEKEGEIFYKELSWLCLNQYGVFNSPVWFNVGLYQQYGAGKDSAKGNWIYNHEAVRAPTQFEYPQCSACFLQGVEDNMDSIMALANSEANLFKHGSGTGTNLSTIRSEKESISGGGKPSGPMSFLRIYDQVANVVKSGGRCLAGNQPVVTANGLKTAKELHDSGEDFITLSYSNRLGRVSAKLARVWRSLQKNVVAVKTDKGEFHVSEDHPFMLSTGEVIKANQLTSGLSLFPVSVDSSSDGHSRVHLKNGKKGREKFHRLIAQDIMGKDEGGYSKRSQIEKFENQFGSYENFYEELRANNHKMVSVTDLGIQDVFTVEVDDPEPDDKRPWTEHNYVIAPIGCESIQRCKGVVSVNCRRSAKLNCLNTWHGDIEEFIEAKPREEKKVHALIEQGYDPSFNGEAYRSASYQNENLSVRADDNFMRAAINGEDYYTYAVTTGEKLEKKDAAEILRKIAEGAWICGDPGLQYDDLIQKWHTCKNTGRIECSNPCLRKGTRLLTKEGWRKIEDLVEEGFQVFDGVSFVQGKAWKTGIKELLKITTNTGKEIHVTPDHEIFTPDGKVEAKNSLGKEIPNVIPQVTTKGNNDLPKGIKGQSKAYNTAGIELMESLGFAQGDGHLHNGVLSIYFTPDKDFIETVVVPTFSDIASSKPRPLSNSRNGYEISSMKLQNWLIDIGFNKVALPERTIPEFVFESTPRAKAAFLRGLFSANGSVIDFQREEKPVRQVVTLTSTCYDLLLEVQLLLQEFGIVSTVRGHDDGTYTSKDSYHLEITHAEDLYKFSRIVNFAQESQKEKLEKILKTCVEDVKSSSRTKRSWQKVVKVEDLGIKDEVYDFNVPTTHYGLANGIYVSNCAEYLFLDETACNLASLNLMKFKDPGYEDGFDSIAFQKACEIFITAQEIIVSRASYPTKEIAEKSHRFRTLGLGYSNLGALLMSNGYPYNSEEGRDLAAAITSLLTSTAYKQSVKLATVKGPFEGFEENQEPMMEVMNLHREANDRLKGSSIKKEAADNWNYVCIQGKHGIRNAQATVCAPTGTISFMMDCDTTGIEPDLALVKHKLLAGGGNLKIVNDTVYEGLRTLGYNQDQIQKIRNYITEHDTIEGAPELKEKDLPVFDCAFKPINGKRYIDYMAHVYMLAATQPFVSGGISKTLNMPEESTVEDIKNLYIKAWELGVKCVAIYRDGSKKSQPLSTKKTESKTESTCEECNKPPERLKLNDTRQSITHKFEIAGHKGYITVGLFENGDPGEVFITMAKEGSTIGGLMDCIGTLTSLCLQYRVPLDTLVRKFAHQSFEPSGFTRNPDIRNASSVIDYLFRFLNQKFGKSTVEKTPMYIGDGNQYQEISNNQSNLETFENMLDAPPCPSCGHVSVRNGACFKCLNCGESLGCS